MKNPYKLLPLFPILPEAPNKRHEHRANLFLVFYHYKQAIDLKSLGIVRLRI